MNYNLCVSLPIKFTSINKVRPIIDKALKLKPNLIELRLDYIASIERISSDFVKDLLNTIQPNIDVIFTLRSLSEGGLLKIRQSEHLKILKMLIETKPDYLDIEINTNKNTLKEIINLTSQNEVKLIFSYHNIEKTLNFDESLKLIQNFKEKLIQKLSLDSKILKDIIYKLVFTAQTFKDNLIPLKLCKEFSNSDQKIISFCMGQLGIFSRIMCVLTGSYLTYASLEEKTAPGQINIKKMRELFDLLK